MNCYINFYINNVNECTNMHFIAQLKIKSLNALMFLMCLTILVLHTFYTQTLIAFTKLQ